jgi:deoxycytidylate deaminase
MSSRRHNLTATIYDKRGRVVAVGVNSYCKSHPLQARYSKRAGSHDGKIYLHAEIAALVKAKRQGFRIRVERYGKDGRPRNAMPCEACMMAIREAGIERVEFTV